MISPESRFERIESMDLTSKTFGKLKVLLIGDLMIDEYLWGEVDRISPEAPVQVVAVSKEEFTLGGAGNVAHNLIALGARVTAVGVIGDDSGGDLLLRLFQELGADTAGIIRESGRPTTRKTRIIAANQHVLRIDRETRRPIGEDTVQAFQHYLKEEILKSDIVLISDYSKGLLTDGFIGRIIALARDHGKKVIVDPKGANYGKYAGAAVLTPNRKEASQAAGIEIQGEADIKAAGARILAQAALDAVLITCGKDGMVLMEKGKESYQIPTQARQVYDVSGAGDTVLATFGLAAAGGATLQEAACLANTAAGIVVGKVGTATVSIQELQAALKPAYAASFKAKSLEELHQIVSALKRQGRRVVMTNGCFDLLHVGHIMLFSASRQMGDVLIVAIDDDRLVSKVKGAGRPVIKADERVRILSALDSVDYVVTFGEGELEKLIQTIQPDILTKGSNYLTGEVVGARLVEAYGGRVALIPTSEKVSATSIINGIRQNSKGDSAPRRRQGTSRKK